MKNAFDYHILDARHISTIIQKPIVDVIITSPPYGALKDYGSTNQIGFGQKYDVYLEDLVKVFEQCRTILKETGSLWIIIDTFKQGGNIQLLPFQLAEKLKAKGWYLQDIIIWQKDKTLPWSSKGKLRNIFEYVLVFTKNPNNFQYHIDELRESELEKWWVDYPERYSPKGKAPSRIWNIPIPVQGWGNSWVRHFCPFPPKLIENILLLTTKEGDVVLDPFAGSGSVLAQATVMERSAIGTDLSKSYREMYYSTVLPYFKTLWQEKEQARKERNRKQQQLESTILALRKTKLAFSIMSFVDKELPKTNCVQYVFIKDSSKVPIYTIVVKNQNGVDSIKAKLQEQALPAKYGSPADIRFMTQGQFSVPSTGTYYVYDKGVHKYYVAELDAKKLNLTLHTEWSSTMSGYVKPVITDIKVIQRNHLLE